MQESNDVFDVLEGALQSHPYFKSQAAAAQAASGSSSTANAAAPAAPSPHAATTPTEGQQADEGATPRASAFDGPVGSSEGAAAAVDEAARAPVVTTATMLTAVRKDRTTFMDQVADAVQRATPSSPTGMMDPA